MPASREGLRAALGAGADGKAKATVPPKCAPLRVIFGSASSVVAAASLLLAPDTLDDEKLRCVCGVPGERGGGSSACKHSALERKPCCAPPQPAIAKHVPSELTAAARPERGV